MSKKLEVIQGALVVTDTDGGAVLLDEPAKEMYYVSRSLDATPAKIQLKQRGGTRGSYASTPIDILLSEAVDSGDASFNAGTFRTFARTELGKSSPQAGGAITVYKTADETKISDTSLVIDDDLQVSLDASSVYSFTFIGYHDSDSFPDIKFDYSSPAGSFGGYFADVSDSSASVLSLNTPNTSVGVFGVQRAFMNVGTIMTTTAGVFGVRWAQNISDGNFTTLKQSSVLILHKLN